MSKAIVPVRPTDWAMIQEIAPVAAASRMFSVTEEQGAIVMLKGHELRLGLATSFEFIYVIDGKPSVSPKGCLALIHSSGELKALEIKDLTDPKGNPTRCRVTMERINGFKYIIEYSMDDAKRANLVKPGSAWEKYPANMLRWRAVGYCADVVFPDVIGGMLRPEELGVEVDEGGEPMWSNVTSTLPGQLGTEPEPMPALELDAEQVGVKPAPLPVVHMPVDIGPTGPTTIDALIAAGHSAEQIVVANEGRVPSTAADCIRVARILKGQDAQS